MLLIGLLLLVAAGVFTGLLIADNTSGGPEYEATVLDRTVGTVDTLGAFLAGVGVTLVFCLALAMIFAGMARRRRARARESRAEYRRAEAPPRADRGAHDPDTDYRRAQAPREDRGTYDPDSDYRRSAAPPRDDHGTYDPDTDHRQAEAPPREDRGEPSPQAHGTRPGLWERMTGKEDERPR
ncbi:hypothetical protein ACFWV1_23695 [Streptomyces sp. NPDC058700]|uniref:hypothetical protein n=1 Tax=Streptomyces sp. NPDC058700 TaxID=3346607 RepID=UPI00364EE9DF